jgi:RNA polymerase sigma factor (sigma-70 family)
MLRSRREINTIRLVPHDPDTALGGPGRPFPETRHSLIEQAAGEGPSARDALDELLTVYWKPAYKHVRIQWSRSNEQAKDLVQGFFAALIEQNWLADYDSSKGRLRTWLRALLDHYVMKQDEAAGRLKRGGGIEFTFDFEAAERELEARTPSPEDVFLHEWEREVFERALNDLREVCRRTGRATVFAVFARYDLAEDTRPSYSDLAAEFEIPTTTVTNYLAWARRELRRLVGERTRR